MCDHLGIVNGQKEAVRATALLHDTGHGPFSHISEEIMRHVNGEEFSHEKVTKLIIEKEESVHNALGSLSTDVLSILSAHDTLASEIISGSVDADKLDYLRRDSYHTGVFYGVFDLERIVRAVCKIQELDRDYFAIDEKGKDALESYRLARYSMHAQVYEHHTRLIADDMFSRAVISCIDDGTFPKEYFDITHSEFLKRHLEMDDHAVEHYILQNGGPVGKALIERIRTRKLFKRAYHVPLTKEGIPSAILRENLRGLGKGDIAKQEKKIADEVNVPPEHIIIHLQSTKIKLYERFEVTRTGSESNVLIRRLRKPPANLAEESPIYASTNPISNLFVFCPKEHVDKVKQISERIFQAQSFV
jgi:HD superfamily phosphohydrolase